MTAARLGSDRTNKLPGEVGIWMMVGGDLLMFGFFFLLFLQYRGAEVDAFRSAQRSMMLPIGVLNTLLLLTSSLLVAQAVRRVQQQPTNARPAIARLLVAAGCGLLFVVDKAVEWSAAIRAGDDIGAGTYFMLYYMFTGIHLLHVLVGLTMLSLMALASRAPLTAERVRLIEAGGVFWHLVDLLWIVLFALFYLL